MSRERFVLSNQMFTAFPIDVFRLVLQYLTMEELCTFDSTLLNHDCRSHFLQAVNRLDLFDINQGRTQWLMMPWLLTRNLLIKNLLIHDPFGDEEITDFPTPEKVENCRKLIIQNSNSLESISLINMSQFLSPDFFLIFKECHNLTSLDFEGCNLTDEILMTLFEGKEILSLNLSSNQELSSVSVCLISVRCPNLQHLMMKSLACVTDEIVTLIIEGCPHLQSLDLSETMITDHSLPLLRKVSSQIQTMMIEKCPQLSPSVALSLMSMMIQQQIFSPDPVMNLKGTQTVRRFVTQGVKTP
jgi:hypothetical protein